MSPNVNIEINPVNDLIDSPLSVKVTGLEPAREITIKSTTEDETKVKWMAYGVFTAGKDGVIDLEKQHPREGTFSVSDPLALLWGMRPEGSLKKPVPAFEKTNPDAPIKITVTVEDKGQTLAQTSFERHFVKPGMEIVREPLDIQGVVGTLFYPSKGGPYPTVICLSGSGGGLSEPRAALIASHGFTALALAYFGKESLRKELIEVPIDFFDTALKWLSMHKAVNPDKIAVFGFSKGAELALLLASRYSRIKAVSAFSPSSLAWQGLGPPPPRSSWTYMGRQIPYVPLKYSIKTILNFILKRPVAFLGAYEKGLADKHAVEAAIIPVEKINGPILLVSGTEDQVWPAAKMSDMIIERLKTKNYPHPYEHIRYENGGHVATMAGLPGAMRFRNLIVSNDSEKNSIANMGAWLKMIEFLKKSLG